MSDWQAVATALLGSWPSQVASWEREGIAAFLAELEARGLTPDQALVAIRCRSDRFPPSAGELAAEARKDPAVPTFEEAYRLIFGPRGVLKARALPGGRYANEVAMMRAHDDAALERATSMHPLIFEFVRRQGVDRLKHLEVNDPEWGELRRKELREAWDRHCEAMEGREVAVLASGRRDGLGRLDPLAVLGGPWADRARREIEAGASVDA